MVFNLIPDPPKLPKTWVRNCTIELREDDETCMSYGAEDNFMFYSCEVGVLARLDGYAIIPIEKYKKLNNP